MEDKPSQKNEQNNNQLSSDNKSQEITENVSFEEKKEDINLDVSKRKVEDLEFIVFHKKVLECIFECDQKGLSQTFQEQSEEYKKKVLNKRDQDGNSLYFIAVKLAHQNPEYSRVLDTLCELGANPKTTDFDYWTPLHEAAEQGDLQLAFLIWQQITQYNERHRDRMIKIKSDLDQNFSSMPDFSLELCYEVDSSFIPMVNRVAPSDKLKITKYKNMCDSTLAGYKGMTITRKNMTSVYNPIGVKEEDDSYISMFQKQLAFIVQDHKIFSLPVHRLSDSEKKFQLNKWIQRVEKRKQEKKDEKWQQLYFHHVTFQEHKSFFGKKSKMETLYEMQALQYDLKVKFEFIQLERATQTFNLSFGDYYMQNQEYFSYEEDPKLKVQMEKYNKKNALNDMIQDLNQQAMSYQSKTMKLVSKNPQNKTLGIWVTKDFPLKFTDFKIILQTFLSTMENQNEGVLSNLNALFEDENLNSFLNLEHSFPIKIQLPLKYSFFALISFQNYKEVGDLNQDQINDLFQIPKDYRYVQRGELVEIMEWNKGKKKQDQK